MPGAQEDFLNLLATYVPPPVLRSLARDPEPVKECKSYTAEGAVMFADISGYTRMTEVFAKEGAVGAEKISGVLNSYFGLQGDIITSYGGDVMRYAGDGLLALWPCESWGFDTPATLCKKCVKCSLQMLKELNNYEITSDVYLQVRYTIIHTYT
jgi:class 3 adenylate cyclase